MVVSGDDVVGFGLQGAGQKLVVGGIVFDPVGFVGVQGDDEGFFPWDLGTPFIFLYLHFLPDMILNAHAKESQNRCAGGGSSHHHQGNRAW